MQREIDHDVCSELILAADTRAGDLIPGLGIIDAVLDDGPGGVLLCSAERALRARNDDELEVFAALCPDCGETLDDCERGRARGLIA